MLLVQLKLNPKNYVSQLNLNPKTTAGTPAILAALIVAPGALGGGNFFFKITTAYIHKIVRKFNPKNVVSQFKINPKNNVSQLKLNPKNDFSHLKLNPVYCLSTQNRSDVFFQIKLNPQNVVSQLTNCTTI